MKATLEFNLDEPEDKQAHLRCVKSLDLVLFIFNIEGKLRGKIKHGNLSDCEYDAIDKFRDEFYEELNSMGLNIDELIS